MLLIVTGSVFAAEDEVSLTITMPKWWVDNNLDAVLYEKPIDQILDPCWIDDPNDPNDFAPQINVMTVKQHITKLIKGFLRTIANRGKRKLKNSEIEHA